MRALAILALLAPLAAAAPPAFVDLHDWASGSALVGVPVDVDALTMVLAFDAPACQRDILLDLVFTPDETRVDVGPAFVSDPTAFRAKLVQGGATLASTDVFSGGYGKPIGRARPGAAEVTLQATQGIDVHFQAKLRGHEVPTDPACAQL